MLGNRDSKELPTAIVIFGGTGHLAETKLLPALYNLYISGLLPETFTIIGLSRKELTDVSYQDYIAAKIKDRVDIDQGSLKDFLKHIRYVRGDFAELEAYEAIKGILSEFDEEARVCSNKLFYLAVPPQLYGSIFSRLKDSNAMALCDAESSWSRLLVEKPFGSDLNTAQSLEAQLCELFSEEQIYRIDHYLAKDAIENILSLRFANSILADSWNGTRIESIELSLYESADVATRGAFYDGIGALRDVGQNHLLQILALLLMDAADIQDASAVRAARLKVLQSLKRQNSSGIWRGQYHGYRDTQGVLAKSETETYFKITAGLDLSGWKDTSVSLESGKALGEARTEAVMTFRAIDQCHCSAFKEVHTHKNILRMTFSPQQSIQLLMWVKEPGFTFKLQPRELILGKAQSEPFRSPEAYEKVLYDCIIGDQTRFVSGAEVIAAWDFITPILEEFKSLPLINYQKGTLPPFIHQQN